MMTTNDIETGTRNTVYERDCEPLLGVITIMICVAIVLLWIRIFVDWFLVLSEY